MTIYPELLLTAVIIKLLGSRPSEEVPYKLCHPTFTDLSNTKRTQRELINHLARNAHGLAELKPPSSIVTSIGPYLFVVVN